jgi:alkylation response protein AidB-like acyl-CoA dehydrogenase
MMTGRPGYAPSEEHELLRRTVRELADAKIAPAAADVDAGSRFPQEALDALTGACLQAAHIPERFGTVPLLLSGSEELKRRYLVPVARGEAMFSYALSEAGFEDTRIPAGRMIGAEGTGFRTALATLDHTRVTIAAQALGIAQGALDYAVGYTRPCCPTAP